LTLYVVHVDEGG